MEMESYQGDLVLFRAPRIVTKLIGIRYMHVGMLHGLLEMIESRPPRVRSRELSLEEGKWVEFGHVVGVDNWQRNKAVEAAKADLASGEPYDYWGALASVWSWLLREKLGIAKVLPLAVTCSSGVAKWWQAGEVTLCLGIARPMPDDLADSLRVVVYRARSMPPTEATESELARWRSRIKHLAPEADKFIDRIQQIQPQDYNKL